ncbi:hypothetical protein R1sor_012373 [Riccia sorocarpa]|uniref:Uncharacterized protein n=1 Tax=Riccia sorocarpa TaxID=122646 RepID=A0ABD3I3K8_9MARC
MAAAETAKEAVVRELESWTHGDDRSFGEGLHKAKKALWPDDERSSDTLDPISSAPKFSPSLPSGRKTRVLSSSAHGGFLTPGRSPLRILVRPSPANPAGDSLHVPSLCSLRQNRNLPALPSPVQVDAYIDLEKTVPLKGKRVSAAAARDLQHRTQVHLVPEADLPVLRPNVGGKNRGHAYVMRSLFRDSSQQILAPIPAPRVVSETLPIIGVSLEVFIDSDLMGAHKCDDEFFCCYAG